jgi:hypothetical protein
MTSLDTVLQGKDTTTQGDMHVSFELGDRSWSLSCSDGIRSPSRSSAVKVPGVEPATDPAAQRRTQTLAFQVDPVCAFGRSPIADRIVSPKADIGLPQNMDQEPSPFDFSAKPRDSSSNISY